MHRLDIRASESANGPLLGESVLSVAPYAPSACISSSAGLIWGRAARSPDREGHNHSGVATRSVSAAETLESRGRTCGKDGCSEREGQVVPCISGILKPPTESPLHKSQARKPHFPLWL